MSFFPEGLLYETEENRASMGTMAALQACMANGTILEAKALICDNEHNLIVDLHGMKGLIPREEGALGIAEGTTRDIAIISRVNKPVCFEVTGFTTGEDGRPMALLSRKKAQQLCMEAYVHALCPGDIIKVKEGKKWLFWAVR